MDYVGCFLSWNKAHHVGPNSRRFTSEPNEHPKTTHIYTTSAVTKQRLQKQAHLTLQPPKKNNSIGQIIINNNDQAKQNHWKMLKNTSLQQN